MNRSRDETFQLMMAHRAAALALEAALKDEATEEYDRGNGAVTWRLTHGRVSAALTSERIVVADQEAFMAWLAVAYPHQVREEIIFRRVAINPAWVDKELLATLVADAEDDDLVTDPRTGQSVPGVKWHPGGTLKSVSVTPNPGTVRDLNRAAANYALGIAPMPGLPSGESHD